MSIFLSLSTFALRQVVGGACETVGFKAGGEVTDQVCRFLGSLELLEISLLCGLGMPDTLPPNR
jgi:hypothetical protein